MTEEEQKLRDMVVQAAATLTQQYGEDAEVVATMRAAEFAAQGDVDALHAWDMIIAYLAAMREGDAEAAGKVTGQQTGGALN
ncbi:MAG: hypothetical protein ACON4V_01050 [Parvibaculales bacterium]